jgi:hypothetical protein
MVQEQNFSMTDTQHAKAAYKKQMLPRASNASALTVQGQHWKCVGLVLLR